jgi:hypothetical protein
VSLQALWTVSVYGNGSLLAQVTECVTEIEAEWARLVLWTTY